MSLSRTISDIFSVK